MGSRAEVLREAGVSRHVTPRVLTTSRESGINKLRVEDISFLVAGANREASNSFLGDQVAEISRKIRKRDLPAILSVLFDSLGELPYSEMQEFNEDLEDSNLLQVDDLSALFGVSVQRIVKILLNDDSWTRGTSGNLAIRF